MREAGINTDIYKPHSVRAASNTKALNAGVPLKEVLKRGQWSNAKTFYHYYYRDIEEWTDDDNDETNF